MQKRLARSDAPVIILVAGGLLQVPMARAIRKLGYALCVVDGNEQCIARELADIFYCCDIRSGTQLIALAIRISARRKIAIALTAATDFSLQVAMVNHALGIAATPIAVATRTTNKMQMRIALKQHRIPIPEFVIFHSENDAIPRTLSFPVVVKPINSMGARGVQLVSAAHEVSTAIQHAYTYSAHSEVLVEQYITDQEYSVEMLVCNYRIYYFAIAVRHITCSPYFVEMGHTIPAPLSLRAARIIKAQCRRTVRALQLRNGAAKFDLFYQNGQVTIGEVACRLSGGYMSGWTFPHSSTIDISAEYVHLVLGHKKRHRRMRRACSSGEYSMLSLPGTIKSIMGIAQARALPGVTHLFAHYRQGDRISFPKNNVQKCISIIIAAHSRQAVHQSAIRARACIDIRLHAGVHATCSFLFGIDGKDFPMAYTLPATLIVILNAQEKSVFPLKQPYTVLPIDLSYFVAGWRQHSAAHAHDFHSIDSEPNRDWHWSSFMDAYECICSEYNIIKWGNKADTPPPSLQKNSKHMLSRSFWRAFIKGGLQGARFYIDTLIQDSMILTQWIEKWDGNIND